MLVGRFLDGLAGSAFLSVAAGTVHDLFIPAQIQAPMMLFTIMPFIGPALGPVIGGFINEFTTWFVLFLSSSIQIHANTKQGVGPSTS